MPPSRRAPLTALLLACAALPARAGWTGLMGFTFESNRPVETKALYCPTGFITGIRVRYGRTKQEDRDLYDFKLKCGTRSRHRRRCGPAAPTDLLRDLAVTLSSRNHATPTTPSAGARWPRKPQR